MFFFFSSRRRHTSLQGDWSSDVCSSDLGARFAVAVTAASLGLFALWAAAFREPAIDAMELPPPAPRGFREALWEALTAQSHRAQVIEPGLPPGNAEPVDR